MSYKMDYRSLKDMYNSIKENVSQWDNALTSLNQSLTEVINSSSISGKSASSVKDYLSVIHVSGLIPAISEYIGLYVSKFGVYYNDYICNVDSNEDSVIHKDELNEIQDNLQRLINTTRDIENEVISTLNSVSDIFTCNRRDVSDVLGLSNKIKNNIRNLDESVVSVEGSHLSSDFGILDTQKNAIVSLINECQTKSRNFKETFTPESFYGLNSAEAFIAANIAVSDDFKKNQKKYETSLENVEDHVAKLEKIEQEEKEQRERIANAIKIGVAVVASVAVIAATAGGAAPVVVGLISAGTAIVSTGANGMLDEYAERGNLKKMDWGKLGIDCAVAGSTSFITGCVGGGLSKTLKEIGPLSKLANSGSGVKKLFGNVVISRTSDIVTGLANNTITETGEWAKKGFKSGGFNGKAIFGFASDQEVNAGNFIKNQVRDVTSSVISNTFDSSFDGFKNSKSSFFYSGDNKSKAIKNAFSGSIKEVTSGIATRASDAAFDNGLDIKKISEKTFDGNKIINDAVKGGVEEGYAGSKKSSDVKNLYKKTYVHTTVDGVKIIKTDKNGNEMYRLYRDKSSYNDVETKMGIKYDRQYIRNGGEIKADSKGNVSYTNTVNNDYEKSHPLETAIKKNFITGDKVESTKTYDSNGKLVSNVTKTVNENTDTIKMGKVLDTTPKDEIPTTNNRINLSDFFSSNSQTVWNVSGGF